jgi:hypothetical protein
MRHIASIYGFFAVLAGLLGSNQSNVCAGGRRGLHANGATG